MLKKYIVRDVTRSEMGSSAMFRCTLCGKTNAQKNNLLNHVEGIHFPNSFVYTCQFCAKTMKTKNALYLHVHTFHKHHKDAASVALNFATTDMSSSSNMYGMD